MKTLNISEVQKFLQKLKTDFDYPKELKIFVFGSAVSRSNPNDLDIIILYNDNIYPSFSIIEMFNKFKIWLEIISKLNVDTVFLSFEEEGKMKFVDDVKAIPLEIYLQQFNINYQKNDYID